MTKHPKLAQKTKFTFLFVAILGLLLYATNTFAYQKDNSEIIKITSHSSLINVGSNDSFAITQDGILAGGLVLNFIEKNNTESAQKAIKLYDTLISTENYGGEYSALQWFCQYLLANDQQKQEFLADKFVRSFYDFFADNNFARLKEYLKRKYKLETFADSDTEEGNNRLAFLEDFILFNNPRREEWEKTSKIVSYLDIKPGERIADVGSGPGYYTFRFSQLVGEKGHIFAIDTVQDHLNYVASLNKKYDINNVEPIKTTGQTIGVEPNQVDLVFLCSLYHNIYGMNKESEITTFVESIKNALKKDGTLVIVDNGLVKKPNLPYHGPYVAKELIIGQMQYYGFSLVKQDAFTPQRYTLIFKKT